MSPFLNKTNLSEPNELGYQFGINKSLTDYAHSKQLQSVGTYLPSVDITVLEVWRDDKFQTYLLVDEKTNSPIDESAGFEAAAVCIDKYKLIKQTEKLEEKEK